MKNLDLQKTYWNSVAHKKTFTHSIKFGKFRELLPPQSKVLDYGCGYGRTCLELIENGYNDIIGIDISSEMIKRGVSSNPNLKLQAFDGGVLPFADNSFSACALLAVLTCIPTNIGQKSVINELYRVLKPNGILYISDYPLQDDDRNNMRYHQFENEFGNFGVFRLKDGGVVRHHDMHWINKLLSDFDILYKERQQVSTMNGNKAEIFQIIAKKKPSH